EAEARGLATGIVTTTRITHATPAATYAHSPNRDWEDDTQVPREMGEECADIARQLVEFSHGDGIEVIMGGGRQHLLPASEADPEYPDKSGRRGDGRNLIAEWQGRHPGGAYVWNREQFDGLKPDTPRIPAPFEPSHMPFHAGREALGGDVPALAGVSGLPIAPLARGAPAH